MQETTKGAAIIAAAVLGAGAMIALALTPADAPVEDSETVERAERPAIDEAALADPTSVMPGVDPLSVYGAEGRAFEPEKVKGVPPPSEKPRAGAHEKASR